jgi:hypothetical protein
MEKAASLSMRPFLSDSLSSHTVCSGPGSFLRASLPRQAETNTAAHTPYLKRDADGLRLGGLGAFRLSLRQSGIPLLARIGAACDN